MPRFTYNTHPDFAKRNHSHPEYEGADRGRFTGPPPQVQRGTLTLTQETTQTIDDMVMLPDGFLAVAESSYYDLHVVDTFDPTAPAVTFSGGLGHGGSNTNFSLAAAGQSVAIVGDNHYQLTVTFVQHGGGKSGADRGEAILQSRGDFVAGQYNGPRIVVVGPNTNDSTTTSMDIVDVSTALSSTSNVESTTLLGGISVKAVDIHGDRVMIAHGNQIDIYDISDPTAPALLNTVDSASHSEWDFNPLHTACMFGDKLKVSYYDQVDLREEVADVTLASDGTTTYNYDFDTGTNQMRMITGRDGWHLAADSDDANSVARSVYKCYDPYYNENSGGSVGGLTYPIHSVSSAGDKFAVAHNTTDLTVYGGVSTY